MPCHLSKITGQDGLQIGMRKNSVPYPFSSRSSCFSGEFISPLSLERVATLFGANVAPSCPLRVFLTGGTGFFGKWLLHTFLGLRATHGIHASLTVLSREPGRFLSDNPVFSGKPGLNFQTGDIRSFDVPASSAFDLVIHGATSASAKLDRENPDEMYSVITEGTRHVLDFAKRCQAKRLLFISSGAVYGPQPPDVGHVPESCTGNPETVYGKGKKVSESLCLEASAGRFDCVIARPFAFVGPHLPLDTHFAIGNFIRDCLENRPVTIRSDGTPLRSYLYAADLAEWLWTLLLKGEHARAYNVGSDEAISIRDLALKVRLCAGTDNPVNVLGTPDPDKPPPRYVPDITRAKSELGLSVRCPLDEAVRRTLAWHRASESHR
jgi:dTDP-glucose 4,6-dehydratase